MTQKPPDALKKSALAYAKKKRPVFPCRLDKRPYTAHGFKEATTDLAQIEKWWTEEFPGASIGMPMGPDSGMWCLDLDLPDGSKSLADLEKQHGPLPDTLCQETGSGGCQFFFEWPEDKTIKNSANAIGRNLDVRGFGGYCVVAPSPHPSGRQYQWLNHNDVLPAPDWLIDLVTSSNGNGEPRSLPGETTPYGQAALTRELAELAGSSEGSRNHNLNRAAFNLGQLVAGGQLNQSQAENALLGVAMGLGLKTKESRKTIESGMKSGSETPRSPDENNGQSGQSGQSGQKGHQWTTSGQPVDKSGFSVDKVDNSVDTLYDLKNAVKAWILLDKRTFRVQDIYSDLQIQNRQQKKNVSEYLSRFISEGLIERVSGQRGVYVYKEKVLKRIDFLDLSGTEESVLDLPLHLEELGIQVLPGNIIVIAGESNSGKTSLTLNIARDNLKPFGGRYESIRYFSSEMGPQELHNRVKAFGEPMTSWLGLEAVERSSGFHQVVDPKGLNIVDFLEVHNEFYLVGEWIRQIHEALEGGVCVVALQKKRGTDFGRGGEISLEKPRLYLSVVEEVKGISSCKVVKAKNYTADRNPNGLQKDFRIIRRGSELRELTEWQFVDQKKRYAMNAGYEVMLKKESAQWVERSIPDNEMAYTFMVEGDEKRVTWRDVRKWRKELEWMDVDDALVEISNESKEKPFLKGKGWFFQVKGQLDNRYKKILQQLEAK